MALIPTNVNSVVFVKVHFYSTNAILHQCLAETGRAVMAGDGRVSVQCFLPSFTDIVLVLFVSFAPSLPPLCLSLSLHLSLSPAQLPASVSLRQLLCLLLPSPPHHLLSSCQLVQQPLLSLLQMFSLPSSGLSRWKQMEEEKRFVDELNKLSLMCRLFHTDSFIGLCEQWWTSWGGGSGMFTVLCVVHQIYCFNPFVWFVCGSARCPRLVGWCVQQQQCTLGLLEGLDSKRPQLQRRHCLREQQPQ